MGLRSVVLVGVCAAALAWSPAAFALPGDPPIVPVSPADGATVPAGEAGVAVRFTCPAYRRFVGDFPAGGGYFADLATSAELGLDGRLRSDRRLYSGQDTFSNTVPAGQCERGFGAFPLPQLAPGTYFWQAWRSCTGCASGLETGPVSRFTIQATNVRVGLRVQARGYVGYPVVASLRLGGVPDESRAVVQRRVGRTWRQVAGASAFRERATVALRLPRGRQRLRVVAQLGAQRSVSAVRVVRMGLARRWSTARDTGLYLPSGGGAIARLQVTSRGREMRNFSAELTVTCFGQTISDNRLVPAVAPLNRVRIAPDGRFYANTGRIELLGRLRNRKVTGTVGLSYGNCAGAETFSARRR